jgi:hypothetical protein
LTASAALAALALAGCPQKESPDDIEFAAQQARKAAQEKKKKVDVFDEFYVDDAKKAPADSKGKAVAATPAPAAAKQSALPLPAASGSQTFSKNGAYVVQVNSTASESEANRLAGKLKSLGYPAYVVTVQNPTPTLTGMYFRVRIGGFDSYAGAKAFAEGTLTPAGYDSWVDRKANDNVGVQGPGSAGGQPQYQSAPQPQQYQPITAPQPYKPATQPQPAATPAPAPQYQPAPAPAQPAVAAPQPAAKPPQPQPAPAPAPQPVAKPTQQQPAVAPAVAPQPAAKPQQQPPTPAPAPQPAAKPQQQPPAPAPAPQPAAAPKKDDWGTTDDWGDGGW